MLARAPPNASLRAQAHFDEHERGAVACDEIDLAAAAAIVALDDNEAAGLQKLGREGLGRGTRAHAGSPARGSGIACPSRITITVPCRAKVRRRGQRQVPGCAVQLDAIRRHRLGEHLRQRQRVQAERVQPLL